MLSRFVALSVSPILKVSRLQDMDGGTFEEVRIAMNELGMYEDIVESGAAQHNQAKTAILCKRKDITESRI